MRISNRRHFRQKFLIRYLALVTFLAQFLKYCNMIYAPPRTYCIASSKNSAINIPYGFVMELQ